MEKKYDLEDRLVKLAGDVIIFGSLTIFAIQRICRIAAFGSSLRASCGKGF